MDEHPSHETLASFLHGRLTDGELARVEDHVAECDACCEVLRSVPPDELIERMRDDTAAPPETRVWRPGEDEPKPRDAPHSVAALPVQLAEHPRYRVVKQLGAGGMGVVYLAEHRLMERTVALKVVNPRLVSDSSAVERFRQEVKAAARLAHRNIVTAYDAEQAGDVHFLVMEYVEGASLAAIIHRRGQIPVLHACNYAMQAAAGLQHAHEHGMVHRDIKPQNLMRTPKGTIKILDFGLARFASQYGDESPDGASGLTTAGTAVGTADYMSPEQARNSRQADIRADIYSLGCTLYHLLAGRVPFPHGTPIEKVVAHFEHPPTPLAELRDDVPEAVIAIVARMMAKDPDERFQSPQEVIEALRPFGLPGAGTETAPIDISAVRGASTGEAEQQEEAPRSSLDGALEMEVQHAAPLSPLAAQPAWSPSRKAAGLDWQRLQRDPRVLGVGGAALVLALLLGGVFVVRGFLTGDGASSDSGDDSPVVIGDDAADDDAADYDGTVDAGREWIDLMQRVEDPARLAVAGDWQLRQGELSVNDAMWARLALPYQPPDEYDLETSFTRHTGVNSVALYFTHGSGQATFEVDAWGQWLAGIQNVGGLSVQENSTRADDVQLVNGRRYTMLVRVRRDRVTAYLDGRLLSTYQGDGSDLRVLQEWDLGDNQALGVGAFNAQTTFHTIRLRPLGNVPTP
jgi:predicted Ser/Thr protein kinase